MLPMIALRLAIGDFLSSELPLAALAATNKVRLVIADFTPNENMAYADLTVATFTGSTALAAALGAQQDGLDPITGDQVVTMVEPLGGWRWITVDAVNLPQTVYGWALCDEIGPPVLLALGKFPEPIALTIAGQEIRIPSVNFRINQQPIS